MENFYVQIHNSSAFCILLRCHVFDIFGRFIEFYKIIIITVYWRSCCFVRSYGFWKILVITNVSPRFLRWKMDFGKIKVRGNTITNGLKKADDYKGPKIFISVFRENSVSNVYLFANSTCFIEKLFNFFNVLSCYIIIKYYFTSCKPIRVS